MFTKSQNNQAAQISELENRVAEATNNLIDSKLSHRRQHNRVVDLRALLDEDPNSPALAAEYRAAEADADAARIAVEKAHQAVHAAERGLDLARTAPLRKANADLLNDAADVLERAIKPTRVVTAQLVEALDRAAFLDVSLATPGPGLFAQITQRQRGAMWTNATDALNQRIM